MCIRDRFITHHHPIISLMAEHISIGMKNTQQNMFKVQGISVYQNAEIQNFGVPIFWGTTQKCLFYSISVSQNFGAPSSLDMSARVRRPAGPIRRLTPVGGARSKVRYMTFNIDRVTGPNGALRPLATHSSHFNNSSRHFLSPLQMLSIHHKSAMHHTKPAL